MTPCTCGRLHADDMDVMASALADQIIESTVTESVNEKIADSLFNALGFHQAGTKRNRPRRRPDFDDYYRFLAPYEARIKRGLSSVWADQQRTIISNLKRTPGPIGGRALAASRIKGLTFDELFEQWAFPKGPANKTLRVVYKTLAEKLMVASAAREIKLHNLSISWDVFNPNIEKWLKTYSIDLADEVNTETLDKLKASLFDGWEAGESIPDLTHRVRDLYEEFDRARAEMIARSESIRASNRGSQETYRASGVVDRTMWVATPTDRTCEICNELDGKVAELGEPFPFEDSYGDASGPPAHPNCRCAVVPILVDEVINDDGTISD
jgi:SPP1 gp7 family putative phage head morphogenesis protein